MEERLETIPHCPPKSDKPVDVVVKIIMDKAYIPWSDPEDGIEQEEIERDVVVIIEPNEQDENKKEIDLIIKENPHITWPTAKFLFDKFGSDGAKEKAKELVPANLIPPWLKKIAENSSGLLELGKNKRDRHSRGFMIGEFKNIVAPTRLHSYVLAYKSMLSPLHQHIHVDIPSADEKKLEDHLQNVASVALRKKAKVKNSNVKKEPDDDGEYGESQDRTASRSASSSRSQGKGENCKIKKEPDDDGEYGGSQTQISGRADSKSRRQGKGENCKIKKEPDDDAEYGANQVQASGRAGIDSVTFAPMVASNGNVLKTYSYTGRTTRSILKDHPWMNSDDGGYDIQITREVLPKKRKGGKTDSTLAKKRIKTEIKQEMNDEDRTLEQAKSHQTADQLTGIELHKLITIKKEPEDDTDHGQTDVPNMEIDFDLGENAADDEFYNGIPWPERPDPNQPGTSDAFEQFEAEIKKLERAFRVKYRGSGPSDQ